MYCLFFQGFHIQNKYPFTQPECFDVYADSTHGANPQNWRPMRDSNPRSSVDPSTCDLLRWIVVARLCIFLCRQSFAVMASRRDWGRTREFGDKEEGLYQCTPGADQEYGSRMSNLVMQFSRMGSSDREFLRVLLESGGNIDHDNAQTPHVSEVGHRASFTPGSELYQNPGRVLHTPSQPPSDSAFDQRTGHLHRSNRVPVLPPPTDAELEQRLGYHPTAVSQALFSPPDSVFPQRPGPSYNHTPVPQIPGPPASGFSSPVPPKLAFFSGEGHKNEASYPQWRSEVESLWKTG